MRQGKILSLALIFFSLSSCGRHEPASEPRPAAVVNAALEGGRCAYRWNGALVSRRVLLQKSAYMLMEAFDRQAEEVGRLQEQGGYPEYDGPAPVDFRLEAARPLPFSCFGPALRIAQLAGFSQAVLRASGERLPDQLVFFDLEPPRPTPRFSAIARIEGSGRITWNGEPTDLNGLREHSGETDRQRPDDVAVAPADEVDFMTFYAAMRAIGQVKAMPTLFGCAILPASGPPYVAEHCRPWDELAAQRVTVAQ